MVLSAGDRVPADARLVEAILLQADEAMLSGESHPVNKTDLPQDKTQDSFRKRYGVYGNHNHQRAGKGSGVRYRYDNTDGADCRYAGHY